MKRLITFLTLGIFLLLAEQGRTTVYYLRADGTASTKVVSALADNGSGKIQVTTSTGHGFTNGQAIAMCGFATQTTCNNNFTVIYPSTGPAPGTTKFDIDLAYVGTDTGKAVKAGPTSSAANCISAASHNFPDQSLAPDDFVVLSAKGGNFTQITPPASGTNGHPITYISELLYTGDTTLSIPKCRPAPIIGGTGLWTQDGATANWYINKTSNVTFSQSGDFGLWEDESTGDGAPLFAALDITNQALKDKTVMTPGTYYWSSGENRLYVQTYEKDDPGNHVIHGCNSGSSTALAGIYVNNKDYLVIDGLWLDRGNSAGVEVNASTGTINNITIQRCIMVDNDNSIQSLGASAKTINVYNCNLVRNGYASLYSPSNTATTMNVYNSNLGGNLSAVSPSRPFAGANPSTHNLYNCNLFGSLRGRYWLKDGNADNIAGGTTNYTNCYGGDLSCKNPNFVSAGGNDLGIATFNSDNNATPATQLAFAAAMPAGKKMTWNINSVLDQPGAWASINTYLGLGHIIGAHTRNHPNLATAAHGADITNAITVRYNGVCTTATVSYDHTTNLLTTSIDGGAGLSINVVTDTNKSGYDCTYLGDATHGLIGYICAQANYVAAYPASNPIYVAGGSTTYLISSTVLADTSGVNIKATVGNVLLDSGNLFSTEIFTDAKTGGMLADFAAQAAPISTYVPTTFSWPRVPWSAAGVARLYAKGMLSGTSSDYFNSTFNMLRMHLGEMFPLAFPIAWPSASAEHLTLVTAQDGIDEAENISAALSMWPMVWNLFSENTDLTTTALTSIMNNLQSRGVSIKDIGQAVADNVTAGAVWDTTNYRLTRKITPTYDFNLKPGSACANTGAIVSLTKDITGKALPWAGGYPIGPYRGQATGSSLGLGPSGNNLNPNWRRR